MWQQQEWHEINTIRYFTLWMRESTEYIIKVNSPMRFALASCFASFFERPEPISLWPNACTKHENAFGSSSFGTNSKNGDCSHSPIVSSCNRLTGVFSVISVSSLDFFGGNMRTFANAVGDVSCISWLHAIFFVGLKMNDVCTENVQMSRNHTMVGSNHRRHLLTRLRQPVFNWIDLLKEKISQ